MSNPFLNSERPLHSLTKKEFNQLKKSGMLWELYPEAPEYWSPTKGKREIKFRVWDGFNKKYINPEGYYFSTDVKEFVAFDRYFNTDEEEFSIQLYTGLKDENDVEIYEGDFVKARMILANHDYYDSNGVVVFGDAMFKLNGYGLYEYTDIEVIGNIFEKNV